MLSRFASAILDGGHARALAVRAAQRRALVKLCRRSRLLVLTYDDGPGKDLTPRLLDLLRDAAQPAVFFLLGLHALRHQEMIDRIVSEGHEIGCHGQNHVHAWRISPKLAVEDMELGYATLSKWLGPSASFRPPYGKLTMATLRASQRQGAKLAWWTVDSGDTFEHLPASPQIAVDAVARHGGGVVLMHDFDRQKERADFVLQTTSGLLQMAQREGLAVRRLSDIFQNSKASSHDLRHHPSPQ